MRLLLPVCLLAPLMPVDHAGTLSVQGNGAGEIQQLSAEFEVVYAVLL